MIKNDSQAPSCTCPSGDGSLVHPCPAHPAVDQADVAAKLTFINGRPAMCGCQVEYSDGGGEYSDVIYVTLCAKHSGSAILDLVATNRIALTPEYEGQWHADLYLDREIPLAKVEGATPAEAVLALMSAERIDPEQESVEQASGDERAAFEAWATHLPMDRQPLRPDLYMPQTQWAWEAWQFRAALAQPSQSQYEANFEEWLANELEGEDGQPVPAAVCDIALARRAFNHWPKLEQPAKVGGVRFSAGVSSRLVVEAAQRLYEFESTPEQEAERPEVVAYRTIGRHEKHQHPHYALNYYKQNAEDQAAHWRERGCEVSEDELMTVAQHDRIFGALRADRDSWAEQAEQRLADWDEMRKERDAALARVAELEKQVAVAWGAFHFGGERDGKLYTHCETEAQIDAYILDMHRSSDSLTLRKSPLYAAPFAQNQPTVPDGYALIPVRETEAMHDAVMALLYKGVARTDTQKLLDAYIAAAPAQAQHSVPEGWKLVPVEPTEDVLEAIHNGGYVGDDQELRWFYQSILAAAPAPGGE
ncbi:TPA: hypothetical protein ACKRLF_003977 [Pseudomonas aeruginosa]